jgi:glycosyltransferase involved in cell wall biosynthesis
MPQTKKSICIISFSQIDGDARVLRQIEHLSPHYKVVVIGYGDAELPGRNSDATLWLPVAAVGIAGDGGLRGKLKKRALLLSGKLHPNSYDRWYWQHPLFNDALAKAVESGADAIHANDWNALPVAVEAARTLGGACVVFDAHEYAPLEFANRRTWRWAYSSMIKYMLRRYAKDVDVSITVAPLIAERYRQEFGLNPVVILNAPSAREQSPIKETKDDSVRLIHHGAAIPDRRLEVMIAALARCHRRYTLHFMLTGANTDYAVRLKKLSDELAPGRVFFHNPVAPMDVVRRLVEFDMGFCYIAPTNYNYLVSLPNKFFDFIAAGLPVCTGPSPSMAEIVNSYKLGCVASSFEPEDLASALNSLSAGNIAAMRAGARAAAKEINAEHEMAKLVELYERLLSEEKK